MARWLYYLNPLYCGFSALMIRYPAKVGANQVCTLAGSVPGSQVVAGIDYQAEDPPNSASDTQPQEHPIVNEHAVGRALPSITPSIKHQTRLQSWAEGTTFNKRAWYLTPTRDCLNRLVTQLKWRLLQGGGTAIYEVGVLDDSVLVGLSRREMRASLDTLEAMASHLGARAEFLRVIIVQRYPAQDPTTSSPTSPAMSAASGPTPPPALLHRRPERAPAYRTSPSVTPNCIYNGSQRKGFSSHPPTLRSNSPSHTPSSSLPSPPSTSLPPFRTMAQIHAAEKVLNATYLLREHGAKRRGSRAGPADIVNMGLLDVGQARKWIGGGKRTFSADLR
ncbi:hypothetical protein CF326_g6507 [Tilletia indica]|nr:hypothetical protein CF326_g6507 [Tilletia indica]